jgi:NAD(P)-dependent dehydrogenase (short-subunit alcohol dehydrogenase family)
MKTIVITGVSRGIGQATAGTFLDRGWHVIGTARAGASPLIHENLQMYRLDLAKAASISSFVQALRMRTIALDAVLNNAGIGLPADTEHLSIEVLRETLEVNLIGLIALTEALLPIVLDGGHIINVSSALASLTQDAGTWSPAYRISKAGVNMYTRHLAEVLRKRHITVSSFDPGWVRTDMGSMSAPRDPSEPAEELFALATASVESGYFWRGGKKRAW